MTPRRQLELVQRIRGYLAAHDGLRRAAWRGQRNPLAGHCYVASEVAYHLGAGLMGYKPATVRHEGSVHWYLVHGDGRILDLTVDQFKSIPPYAEGRRRGFLTCAPSRRALTVMRALRRSHWRSDGRCTVGGAG